jgi:hypothetical protein
LSFQNIRHVFEDQKRSGNHLAFGRYEDFALSSFHIADERKLPPARTLFLRVNPNRISDFIAEERHAEVVK